MKKTISILIVIAIAAVAVMLISSESNSKKLDKQEQAIEEQVEQLNQDAGPTELDEVYSGPNDDRPLSQDFL